MAKRHQNRTKRNTHRSHRRHTSSSDITPQTHPLHNEPWGRNTSQSYLQTPLTHPAISLKPQLQPWSEETIHRQLNIPPLYLDPPALPLHLPLHFSGPACIPVPHTSTPAQAAPFCSLEAKDEQGEEIPHYRLAWSTPFAEPYEDAIVFWHVGEGQRRAVVVGEGEEEGEEDGDGEGEWGTWHSNTAADGDVLGYELSPPSSSPDVLFGTRQTVAATTWDVDAYFAPYAAGANMIASSEGTERHVDTKEARGRDDWECEFCGLECFCWAVRAGEGEEETW